jgi:hypothetical protein
MSACRRESTLDLQNVAPALMALGETEIPMPGVRQGCSSVQSVMTGFDNSVTVVGVIPKATTLRTKTRPKKLALLGSDGREYTFLLKVISLYHLLDPEGSAEGSACCIHACASVRCDLVTLGYEVFYGHVHAIAAVESSSTLLRMSERLAVCQAGRHSYIQLPGLSVCLSVRQSFSALQ